MGLGHADIVVTDNPGKRLSAMVPLTSIKLVESGSIRFQE